MIVAVVIVVVVMMMVMLCLSLGGNERGWPVARGLIT
jgi:hypothetical protein